MARLWLRTLLRGRQCLPSRPRTTITTSLPPRGRLFRVLDTLCAGMAPLTWHSAAHGAIWLFYGRQNAHVLRACLRTFFGGIV